MYEATKRRLRLWILNKISRGVDMVLAWALGIDEGWAPISRCTCYDRSMGWHVGEPCPIHDQETPHE